MNPPNPSRCVDDMSIRPENWVPVCSHFLYDGLYHGLLKACTVGGDVHELETMEMRQTERCGCGQFRPKTPSPAVRKSVPEFLKKIVINAADTTVHNGRNPTEGRVLP